MGETARCLFDRYAADHLITAIKDNQPTMLDDLCDMDFSACPPYETLDKEHGRREWIKDCMEPEWDGSSGLCGRQQALRIERQGHRLNSSRTSTEVTLAFTSLAAELATPQQLPALARHHLPIENRLHAVRDLPGNLACLTSMAISIIRCQARFRYVPDTNGHSVNRAKEALD